MIVMCRNQIQKKKKVQLDPYTTILFHLVLHVTIIFNLISVYDGVITPKNAEDQTENDSHV